MKGSISALLVFILIISATMSFSSCGKRNKEPEAPEGYQMFPLSQVTFAYPTSWFVGVTAEGVTKISNPTGKGPSITVVSEVKTTLYETISAEELFELSKSVYESAGMTVTNPTKDSGTTNGIDVIIFRQDAFFDDNSYTQHIYILTVDNYTYSVTVTVDENYSDLPAIVFDTLYVKSTWEVIKDLL